MATKIPIWLQKQVTLSQRSRGCHLITHEITSAIRKELAQVQVGICHIFILHTSAVRFNKAHICCKALPTKP